MNFSLSVALNLSQRIWTRPSWERILLFGTRGCVFLAILTPLVFTNHSFFPTNPPQTIFFRVLVAMSFGLYLLLLLESRTYLPKFSHLLVAVCVFIGTIFLTSMLGIHPAKSFWSTLNRMEGVIAFIHYGAFFLVLSGVFRQTNDWLRLMRVTLFVSVAVGLIGLLEYFSFTDFLPERGAVDATLGNPSLYAGYLIFIIGMGVLATLKEQGPLWQAIAWIITMFNAILLLFAGSRGAWLGIVLGIGISFLVWLLVSPQKALPKKSFRSILIGLLIFFAIFFTVISAWQSHLLPSNPFWERYTSMWQELENFENNSRLFAWRIAIQEWRQSPLLGYGLESFIHLYDRNYEPSFLREISENTFFDRTHNVFLELLVTSGVFGLGAYLAIFASAGMMLVKTYKRTPSLFPFIILALFIAHFTQNMFVFDTTNSSLLFFFVLAFIHATAVKEQSETQQKPFLPFVKFIAALIILTGIGAIAYIANTGYWQATANLAKGYQLLYTEEHDRALPYLERACTAGPASVKLDACRLGVGQLLRSLRTVPYSNENKKLVFVTLEKNLAILENSLQEHSMPIETRYLLMLHEGYRTLYLEYRDAVYLGKAENALQEALRINPRVPQLYRRLGELKIFRGNRDEGIAMLRKAIEMHPNPSLPMIRRIVALYGASKEFDQLADFLEETIQQFPNQPPAELYVALARSYKELEDEEQLLETKQRLFQDYPELKKEELSI